MAVTTDRFVRLFADTERELLAYVLRRVDRAEGAADARRLAFRPKRSENAAVDRERRGRWAPAAIAAR